MGKIIKITYYIGIVILAFPLLAAISWCGMVILRWIWKKKKIGRIDV